MKSKFISFLEILKTEENSSLIESITEGYSMLFESVVLATNQVPMGIRNWVSSKLGKNIQKYTVEQKGSVTIDMPWHEADREYYQMFSLSGSNAVPMDDVQFQRSGMEGDGVMATGHKIAGEVQIPSGYVLVCAGIYPMRATIYTADDATKMLPPAQGKFELTDDEVVALQQSRTTTPAYRIKFPDAIYNSLIEKGLMKKNKSTSIDGINYLSTLNERIKQISKDNETTEKYGFRLHL